MYNIIMKVIAANWKMASNNTEASRKVNRSSFPFHPKCLNFKEKRLTGETMSQEKSKITAINEYGSGLMGEILQGDGQSCKKHCIGWCGHTDKSIDLARVNIEFGETKGGKNDEKQR